jgi:hypothetical protein
MVGNCKQCESLRAELAQAKARIAQLQAECHELTKLVELQQADPERYRKAYEQVDPNCPERVPVEQLQLAFERVLQTVAQQRPANDAERDNEATQSTGCQPAAKRMAIHKTRRRSLSERLPFVY